MILMHHSYPATLFERFEQLERLERLEPSRAPY
jgi:hypothetical protein